MLLAVYAARARSFVRSEVPYWPRSRRGAQLYVAAMFFLPVVMVVTAALAVASGMWLPGAALIAMTITPMLLRLYALGFQLLPTRSLDVGEPRRWWA